MRLAGEGTSVKPGAFTTSAKLVDSIALPDVPVIVTRYEPYTTELPTVSVSVLLLEAGLALQVVLTSLGSPETERFTLEEKPGASVTVMVAVPEPPGVTVTVLAEEASLKLGVAGGARASISAWPPGVPHPVTRS